MKKSFFSAACVVVFALPFVAQATQVHTGNEYTLRDGETVVGNMYVAAGNTTIIGKVEGDLTVAGGTIFIKGNVTGDVIIAGGTTDLVSAIGGDVRIVAGQVTISGAVAGDILVMGGNIHVVSGAHVDGDVIAAGGRIILDGSMSGSVTVAGGSIDINDVVGGGARVMASKVSIGPHAVIKGDFSYDAPEQATIRSGAVIGGKTEFRRVTGVTSESLHRGWRTLFALWAFIKFLAILTAGIVLVLAFRDTSNHLVERAVGNFWKDFVRGFILLFITPVVVGLLLFSIIGGLIGGLLLVVYITLIILARVYTGIVLGVWIARRFFGKDNFSVMVKGIVLGNVLLVALGFIPVLGSVVKMLFFGAVLGAIAHRFYERRHELATS